MYCQWPNGVLKVVRCLSEVRRGTLWYPFQASVTVFQESLGMRRASWKGNFMA